MYFPFISERKSFNSEKEKLETENKLYIKKNQNILKRIINSEYIIMKPVNSNAGLSKSKSFVLFC